MKEHSIIDRAARALFECQPRIEKWDNLSKYSKFPFKKQAIAVIAAIREPSATMIENASNQIIGPPRKDEYLGPLASIACYKSMINTILDINLEAMRKDALTDTQDKC